MRKLTAALALALPLVLGSAACNKDDASCEAVVDHTLSLLPAEWKAQADEADMIAKCEKETTEAQRRCAVAAESMEALAACKKEEG